MAILIYSCLFSAPAAATPTAEAADSQATAKSAPDRPVTESAAASNQAVSLDPQAEDMPAKAPNEPISERVQLEESAVQGEGARAEAEGRLPDDAGGGASARAAEPEKADTGASGEDADDDAVAGSVRILPTRGGGDAFRAGRDDVAPWYRTGFGALTIVLVVMLMLYAGARRWAPTLRTAEGGALRVVARAGLTPKHQAALVQLGRRYVLVGAGPDSINVLSEITDPEEVAELTVLLGASNGQRARGFDRVLQGESQTFQHGGSEEGDDLLHAEHGGSDGEAHSAFLPGLAGLKARLRAWRPVA